MAKINELIAADKLPQAADEAFNLLHYVLNSAVPGVGITREEFAKVAPELVKKLQDPARVIPGAGSTQEPGDEITIAPSKTLLTINFTGDDLKELLPKPITKTYNVGSTYNYVPPAFEGFTATPKVVTGKMPATNHSVTVNYAKDA